MATIDGLICSSYSSPSTFFHKNSNSSFSAFSRPFFSKSGVPPLKLEANDIKRCSLVNGKANLDIKSIETYEKMHEIHSIEDYEKVIEFSNEKLVIAHFSASDCRYNTRVHRFMEQQGVESNEIKFLHVMVDESDKTMQICIKEKIEKIPHFVFYKNTEKIHEEAGYQPEKLVNNILYFKDDPFSPVVQLHGPEDLEKLKNDHEMVVVNVCKTKCAPCVKIYPSVLKLASQMAGKVVFARMNADENNGCGEMLREMNVLKVPAFLFFVNGEFCGQYVGCSASMLIREIEKIRSESIVSKLWETKTALTE